MSCTSDGEETHTLTYTSLLNTCVNPFPKDTHTCTHVHTQEITPPGLLTPGYWVLHIIFHPTRSWTLSSNPKHQCMDQSLGKHLQQRYGGSWKAKVSLGSLKASTLEWKEMVWLCVGAWGRVLAAPSSDIW